MVTARAILVSVRLSWPCAQMECKDDFSAAVCPDGWTMLPNGICLVGVDVPSKPGCEARESAILPNLCVVGRRCDVFWCASLPSTPLAGRPVRSMSSRCSVRRLGLD